MYAVTKQIEFCYGHRLLDYDGVCRHLHGHNAVVEIEVRADVLDERNMVVDFLDIKRVLKAWIDREIDHERSSDQRHGRLDEYLRRRRLDCEGRFERVNARINSIF